MSGVGQTGEWRSCLVVIVTGVGQTGEWRSCFVVMVTGDRRESRRRVFKGLVAGACLCVGRRGRGAGGGGAVGEGGSGGYL